MTTLLSPARRASVPAVEAFVNYTADARPAVNTTVIPVKKGDIIDVGILWDKWLAHNFARIKTSAWAAAGAPVASPDTPDIDSSTFDERGESVCILDTSAAEIGDEYYLENTVVVERDAALTGVVFPDRTLVRRLHVKVAAG